MSGNSRTSSGPVPSNDDELDVSTWSPSLTVVGIGASAGGLSALKKLLAKLPPDTGMAYVIVVHLSPERPSVLAELLQTNSAMPVRQVTGTSKIEPNHVYVIPPGRNLSAIDSHLRLSDLEEQRRERAPIDHFLCTLANTHQENAVGVILSGTGGDGAIGLGMIKEQGGVALAQDPGEAEFAGMPQAAISTGAVDRVLTLDTLAEELVRLASLKVKVPLPNREGELSHGDEALLGKILASVQEWTGHDFSRYKQSTILRRLRRRMQLRHVQRMDQYWEIVRQDQQEAQDLFDDLLITVTHFFRDTNVFEAIDQQIVPRLFKGKKTGDKVRVWVVGCATGEEAYSYAMLMMEHSSATNMGVEIQIFASDLHERSLKRAREGYFPDSTSAYISKERLSRFFIAEKGGGYRIKKIVRDAVVFAPHNFMRDPPFSHIDLVSCRNVLIYLQRDVQVDILQLFHYALNPDGVLVLGTSETVDKTDDFKPFLKEYSIFTRQNVRARGTSSRFSVTRRRRDRQKAD